MPHSSGGSSHSSGGHSGGGGSSHSSGGSSHSGGSSSSSYNRVSFKENSFAGATRYVHYSNGSSKIVYANKKELKRADAPRWFCGIFYIPFIVAIFVMLFQSITFVRKLDTYRQTSTIQDSLNILGDEADMVDLKNAIRNFYDKTGISICVVTISNEKWKENYSSLEDFAYDYYVSNIYDEDHWVLAYSQQEDINFSDKDFVDWYYEGMQGDNTDAIINAKFLDRFNSEMQKNLTRVDGQNIAKAISKTISNNLAYIPVNKLHIVWVNLGPALIMMAFISFHAYFMIFAGTGTYKKEYKECPKGAEPKNCEYCGGLYYLGTVTKCPHCNAPIKV